MNEGAADQAREPPDDGRAQMSAAIVRRPVLAFALSAIGPGLGQVYNRQPLQGIAVAGVTALLVHAALVDPRLAGFVAAFWLYQALDAWSGAAGSVAPAPPFSPPSRFWTWGLIVTGSLLLIETNTSMLSRRATLLVPLFLIASGGRLLYTYFRSPDGQA